MMELQKFAEQVTAELIGVEHEVLAAAVASFEAGEVTGPIVGIDIIAIIALIEMLMPIIMDLIDNCPANDERVRKSIQKPRLMQRVRFRRLVNRAVRQGEPRWRNEASEIGSIMLKQASNASDETVDAVVDECRNLSTGIEF